MKITSDFRRSALRRGIVVRAAKDNGTDARLVKATAVEMANLGFIVRPDDMAGMSVEALQTMIEDARIVVGADRALTPVYPGFPLQVEALDTLTLLTEQILHYWSAGALLPNYPETVRASLPIADMIRDAREISVLKAADAARALTLELSCAPIAMSEDERTLLQASMTMVHPDLDLMAEVAKQARNGENLQTAVEAAFAVNAHSQSEMFAAVLSHCDNVDQLLRVVLALASKPAADKWASNYDLAIHGLADRHSRAVRMTRLPRPDRRLVLERLGALTDGYRADSLVRRRNLWRTVLRASHAYEFNLTSAQRRALDIVSSNVEYRTLNSSVEASMENGDVATAVALLAEHNPGELLTRLVALLRIVSTEEEAKLLAKAVRKQGSRSRLTTLINAYNGVVSANDAHVRVTRVAGLNNTMVERKVSKIRKIYLKRTLKALRRAMITVLATRDAPSGPVAIEGTQAMPLVRRDAAVTDRVLDRGSVMALAGKGDVLRIFGHWNNDKDEAGYMDIGAVALDDEFNQLAVCTWDTYAGVRDWAVYSGDKYVQPGDFAAEYVDVKLNELRRHLPKAQWVAMTVQSWTGWPTSEVDFIAGAMLRTDGTRGEVFDARTVATAFKPTTDSTQSVPLVVNVNTGEMVWVDSSNGSTSRGVSSSRDATIGAIVYDEVARPRLTMGELAELYAQAHGVETSQAPVSREQILGLLG